MIKNSMRQMLRTPIKSFLFFLLLSAAVFLLALGGCLGAMTVENQKRFDRIFVTIGTVQQKPQYTQEEKIWDAEDQDYTAYNRPVYGDRIDESALDIEGVNYISGPENRPYYISVHDSYMLYDRETAGTGGGSSWAIVEVQPLEDCIPNEPVKLKIIRTLYSYFPVNSGEIYFCDHNNENPEKLFADKTYIMSLQLNCLRHGMFTDSPGPYESIPCIAPDSSQKDENGDKIPCDLSGKYIEEVTEGFYETEAGKAWLELVKAYKLADYSIPVTPVSDISLLMSFYNKDAYIKEGRSFEETDYEEGKKVCLVSGYFAKNNKLEAGDKLPLSLIMVCFGRSTQQYLPPAFLNAQGKFYEAFEEEEYEIIGIYDLVPGTDRYSDYTLQNNEVLIPYTAVGGTIKDNIAYYGPMKGYNTSFRIPNGSIERYKELWEKQENGELDIQFYDRGYTQLKKSLDSIRKIAVILVVSGSVTVLLILIFFCHLFITGQNVRTAIERSLGMGRWQCMVSMMSAVLILAAAGGFVGSAAGGSLTGKVAERMEGTPQYNREFSDGAIGAEEDEKAVNAAANGKEAENNVDETEINTSVNVGIPMAAGGIVFISAGMIAYIMMWGNLKKEPLELLTQKN
ncbi:MAG: hypothetical protein Q4F83_13970 [Eubacteriales bacterium]|nr:hypothetical protein [Eubacteriales bacterium]